MRGAEHRTYLGSALDILGMTADQARLRLLLVVVVVAAVGHFDLVEERALYLFKVAML